MDYYLCEYVGFKCGIYVEEEKRHLIHRMASEYKNYYTLKNNDIMSLCDSYIYILNDAYKGNIEGDEVSIHSSHSRNLKYLLNGSIYTQEDANILAFKKDDDECIYYYIPKYKVKVLVKIKEKKVYISGDNLYEILIYVYETLLCLFLESQGGIHLHGACFKWNEKGYIVTGKSGGGKTTFLFEMLKRGAIFHSNDRVTIIKKGNDLLAYSIPIPVNVPIKMMKTLEEWKNISLIKNATEDSKIRFHVYELEKLFSEKSIAITRIDEVIIVDYSEEESINAILSNDNIVENLELLSPYDKNHPKWLPLFSYPGKKDVELNIKKMCEELVVRKISGRSMISSFEKGREKHGNLL